MVELVRYFRGVVCGGFELYEAEIVLNVRGLSEGLFVRGEWGRESFQVI